MLPFPLRQTSIMTLLRTWKTGYWIRQGSLSPNDSLKHKNPNTKVQKRTFMERDNNTWELRRRIHLILEGLTELRSHKLMGALTHWNNTRNWNSRKCLVLFLAIDTYKTQRTSWEQSTWREEKLTSQNGSHDFSTCLEAFNTTSRVTHGQSTSTMPSSST